MQAEERTDDEDDARPDEEDEGADSAEDAEQIDESDAGDDAAGSDDDAGDDEAGSDDDGGPEASSDSDDSGGGDSGSGDAGDENAEGIAAPSIGPDTEIEREPPEERLARHEQSTTDAMGNDKRRAVTDQAYGASKARRLALYGAFLAVIVVLVVGARIAVSEFDVPRERADNATAPWADEGAPQIPPAPLNFPRNGTQDLDAPDSELGDNQDDAQVGGPPDGASTEDTGSAQGSGPDS